VKDASQTDKKGIFLYKRLKKEACFIKCFFVLIKNIFNSKFSKLSTNRIKIFHFMIFNKLILFTKLEFTVVLISFRVK
jgi:hypothetical protein